MRKPKVSTPYNRDYIARENEKRVINIVQEKGEIGCPPKEIARILSLNQNTVKSMLPRLCSKNLLCQNPKVPGNYCIVDKYRHGVLFDWKFHNGIFTYTIENYKGERKHYCFDSGYWKYDFEIGAESKKATFRIICSENPIEIASVYNIYLIFALLIEKYAGIFPDIKEVIFSSVEFNKDYANLRIDGEACIVLDELLSQFKIYQKQKINSLRTETKPKVPFNLDILIELLNRASSPIENYDRMSKIEKRYYEISNSHKNIIHLLNSLLKKLDENKQGDKDDSVPK